MLETRGLRRKLSRRPCLLADKSRDRLSHGFALSAPNFPLFPLGLGPVLSPSKLRPREDFAWRSVRPAANFPRFKFSLKKFFFQNHPKTRKIDDYFFSPDTITSELQVKSMRFVLIFPLEIVFSVRKPKKFRLRRIIFIY